MKLKLPLLFFFFYVSGWAQSGFQKYFSDFIENQKFSVSSFDSTYLIAGNRWFEGSFYDFCAVKLDKGGKVLWSKSFPSSNDDYLSALSISPSGDIFLSGYKSNNAGDYDFSLMKLDASGNLQWYKTYGAASSEVPFFVGRTSSGDFFLSGNRDVTQQPMIIKTNGSGTVLWSKTFGTSSNGEEGLVAAITKDGGLAVCGALPAQKNFLMKVNPDGTTAWCNSYTNSHTQFISSLKQTGDGGFALASSDYRCDTTGCHSYFAFIKLDANGSVSWAKAVENHLGAGRNGVETPDGGFIFTGQLRDSSYSKAVLIKTDSNGNILWTKAYGNADSFGEGFFVEQTPDNGFAILGVEDSKAYLIKTDVNGNSGCHEKILNPILSNMDFAKSAPVTLSELAGAETTTLPACADTLFALTDSIICNSTDVNEILSTIAYTIYPNPFSESTTLEIIDHKLLLSGIKFNMYDVFGRQVMQTSVADQRSLIFRGDLPGGMYFYEIYNGQKVIGKGKIITE